MQVSDGESTGIANNEKLTEQLCKIYPEAEAHIDYEFIYSFGERGVWIGPYYYYVNRDEKISQSSSKGEHYPVMMNAMKTDQLISMIKERHIVTIDYYGMGMSAPVQSHGMLGMPELPRVHHSKVCDYTLDVDYPEDFLEINGQVDQLELQEVSEELVSQTVPEFDNLYSELLYMVQNYIAPLDIVEAKRCLIIFKRLVVLMNENPVGLSLLAMEKEFAKLVKAADFVFASSAATVCFPATNLKDPLMDFKVSASYDDKFFHYFSWPECNRNRLVCKRWYNVYKDMYHSNKVYYLAGYREKSDWPKMVTRNAFVNVHDMYAGQGRDKSCVRCRHLVCSCEFSVDTMEGPHTIAEMFFNKSPVITNVLQILDDKIKHMSSETMIALAALYSRRRGLAMCAPAWVLLRQLPLIIMMQTRLSKNLKREKRSDRKPGYILWKDKKYKVLKNKKIYPKNSKLGDYRTKLIGGHKVHNDPF